METESKRKRGYLVKANQRPCESRNKYRRAKYPQITCCIKNLKPNSKSMLADLNWPSLQSRRRICGLRMFYKIPRGPASQHLPSIRLHLRTRASHAFKIRLPSSSVGAYKHSYYARSIPVWNALPAAVVSFSSYPEFIRRVCLLI